jgi:ketosteroid isomerase-like protein
MSRQNLLISSNCLLAPLLIAPFAFPSLAATEEPVADPETRAVVKVLSDQEAAWNKGDLKGFMGGYWNSPELTFYSGRDKRKGWKETYERYQERYQKEGREMGKLAFSELLIERLSDTKMLVRGRWKLKLSDDTIDGLFSLIVEKKPEGWRIVHDHTSAGEQKPKNPKKEP